LAAILSFQLEVGLFQLRVLFLSHIDPYAALGPSADAVIEISHVLRAAAKKEGAETCERRKGYVATDRRPTVSFNEVTAPLMSVLKIHQQSWHRSVLRPPKFAELFWSQLKGDLAEGTPHHHVEDVAIFKRPRPTSAIGELNHRLVAVEEGESRQLASMAIPFEETDVPAFSIGERHEHAMHHVRIVGEIKAKLRRMLWKAQEPQAVVSYASQDHNGAPYIYRTYGVFGCQKPA
jgi:hypothetical protein